MNAILTSAIVAAFVSLALEYFAKPRLEARKERILEDVRARRQAAALLNEGELWLRVYMAQLEPDDSTFEERADHLLTRVAASRGAMLAAMTLRRTLIDGALQFAMTSLVTWLDELDRIASSPLPHSAQDVVGLEAETPRVLQDLTEIRELMEMSRWHWIKRLLLLDEIHRRADPDEDQGT